MGAKHVTPEEVIEMQRLYRELGTYSAVGQRIGRSGNTVAKYVNMYNVPRAMRIAINNLVTKK